MVDKRNVQAAFQVVLDEKSAAAAAHVNVESDVKVDAKMSLPVAVLEAEAAPTSRTWRVSLAHPIIGMRWSRLEHLVSFPMMMVLLELLTSW